jgi:hypothetical protein
MASAVLSKCDGIHTKLDFASSVVALGQIHPPAKEKRMQ